MITRLIAAAFVAVAILAVAGCSSEQTDAPSPADANDPGVTASEPSSGSTSKESGSGTK